MPEFYMKLLVNLIIMVVVTIGLQLIRNYSRGIHHDKIDSHPDTKIPTESVRKAFIAALYAMIAELGVFFIIISLLSSHHQTPRVREACWLVLMVSIFTLVFSRVSIPKPKNIGAKLFVVPNVLAIILMLICLIFLTPSYCKNVVPLAFLLATIAPTYVYAMVCVSYLDNKYR